MKSLFQLDFLVCSGLSQWYLKQHLFFKYRAVKTHGAPAWYIVVHYEGLVSQLDLIFRKLLLIDYWK